MYNDNGPEPRRGAIGLPAAEPLPASHCSCGAELLTDREKGIERCGPCDERAFAKWSATTRRQADAILTRGCPSLTEELRAELLDAGLRPWQATKVNALIRVWGAERNNRMGPAERTADLRARIVAELGAES